MTDLPSFETFYAAANRGRNAFPWQRRLAEQVIVEGWPREIGVPTGLGKTACIDIAVWALAHRAPGGEAPTRIWYVVNRRLLVDAAWDRALALAALLRDPVQARVAGGSDGEGAIRSVADALASLGAMGSEEGPLQVTRLRGGAEIGSRPPDPSQPALILATVPMFVSRWLFRGYGSSRSMRPIDAALAGADSLVLLDEAHLSMPLLRLRERVASCDVGRPDAILPAGRSRPRFVALTATGTPEPGRFDLDDEDKRHPIAAARLAAAKPLTLIDSTDRALADTLASEAVGALRESTQPRSCVVFANTPALAREVHDAAAKALSRAKGIDADLLLVTGRMRDHEADRLRERVLDEAIGVPAGRSTALPRHVLVIATQTLEVGADLDFDILVSETAGVRALTQRLGRLNRLGTKPGARAIICHPADRKEWPVYGGEAPTAWERLQAAAASGPVDLGPARVGEVLGSPHDAPPRVAELLPEHLWSWAKTSSEVAGDPPLEPFYEGFGPQGRVLVAWRAYLPAPGIRLLPALRGAEQIELPIWELRSALGNAEIARVSRIAPDGASLEDVEVDAIKPGDQVVLSARSGLYDEFGWAPQDRREVLDVSGLSSGTLVVAPELLSNIVAAADEADEADEFVRAISTPDDDRDEEAAALLAKRLVETLKAVAPHPWVDQRRWLAFLDELAPVPLTPLGHAPVLPRASSGGVRSVGVRSDAFDEMSFLLSSASLTHHLDAVGQAARRIALALALPSEIVDAVMSAAALHDIGKIDPRFQRWLDPDGEAGQPVAKSATPIHRREALRVAAGWPKGGRHELLSARLARDLLPPERPLRDLVIHLIGSHHGQGRPLIQAVADPEPPLVSYGHEGARAQTSGGVGVIDWEHPGRFRSQCEAFGYWGLALLEAIVRLADHAVSGATEVL